MSRATHLVAAAGLTLALGALVVTPTQAAPMCLGRAATIDMNVGGHPNPTRSDSDVIFGTPGPDTINAGDGNDVICAGDGNDIIDAGAGGDLVESGRGLDTLTGGSGADWLDYRNSGEGIVAHLDGGFVLKFGDGDSFADDDDTLLDKDFEYIVGTNYPDDLYGTSGTNLIFGMGGNDNIHGYGGDDRIEGGAGVDRLYANDGNDLIDPGVNGAAVAGEAGVDRIQFPSAPSAVTVNVGAVGGQNTIGSGVVALSSIENAMGSNFADVLIGNSGSNSLYGGAGNDKLYGYPGNDRLFGEAGNDYLSGYTGTDACAGSTGTDSQSSCEVRSSIP